MSWDAPRLKTGILKMKPRCPDLQYWWVKISDEIGIFSRSILVFQTLLSMERIFMHYFHIEIWWLHHGVFDDFCIQCGTKSGKAILFESHLWHVYLESRNLKFSPYHHISRWFLSTTSKYSTVIPMDTAELFDHVNLQEVLTQHEQFQNRRQAQGVTARNL